MTDKELVHVAGMIHEALWQLQRGRYLECVRQLSLFTGRLQDVACESRKLGLAVSRGWPAATEQCCVSVDRYLNDIPYSVSKLQSLLDRRRKDVPPLAAIVAELRALEQEFDEVAFDPEAETPSAATEPITLEDIYLGPFRVLLPLDKLAEMYQRVPYYVVAIEPHPAAKDEAVTHPHVSNEVVCEGDGSAAIRAALEEGRLCDFFTMVRSILNTYNPDSPYIALSNWHGVSCYDCGYVMDDEDSYYCSHCDNAVCDNCSRVCTDCGEIVCNECVSHCEICDRSLCPACARTRCGDCEAVCCKSCLTDGLCPECEKERDNEDEQATETTDQGSTSEPKTSIVG
jgi:hypothetical protein